MLVSTREPLQVLALAAVMLAGAVVPARAADLADQKFGYGDKTIEVALPDR